MRMQGQKGDKGTGFPRFLWGGEGGRREGDSEDSQDTAGSEQDWAACTESGKETSKIHMDLEEKMIILYLKT